MLYEARQKALIDEASKPKKLTLKKRLNVQKKHRPNEPVYAILNLTDTVLPFSP